jgi:adenylate cyclase
MSGARSRPRGDPDDAFWRDYLTRPSAADQRRRRIFKLLPREPRCRLCAAPFGNPGAPVMRLVGRRPAAENPTVCEGCFTFISRHHGGAEIECTMLFADIRGSTTIAEAISPTAFHELLDRFYTVASTAVFRHEGTIDKFVGDELVAIFLPLLCGDRHAALAIEAALDLLADTGHGSPSGPWVRVGAAVHTGVAWYGTVGHGSRVDVTAVGDAMNVTARLASAAAAGEILVTMPAAERAGLDRDREHRGLALRGRRQATDVIVVGPRS